MTKQLKIHWLSNQVFTPSGYGNQTELFANLLTEAGHEVYVRGFYGHRGHVFRSERLTLLPGSWDEWGNDTIQSDWSRFKPDVGIILADAWVYKPEIIRSVPVCMYAPVDSTPIPPAVADVLRHAKWVWAMSRHGEREMRQAGLDPFYVPHAVDTETYTPMDRSEARRKWGLSDDVFLVVMNAANKGYPVRKSLDRVLKAWGLFIKDHPNAILYLHTNPYPNHHGLNLIECSQFYNIPDTAIRFPDTALMRDGEYTPDMMNTLYNAADVLLAPSQGEGFGIPVIESQAAGCPVIVSNFTAQRELLGAGHGIDIDPIDETLYTLQGSEQAIVPPSKIITALEWAWQHRGDTALRAKAREFAMCYDARHIFQKHALPAIQTMAQANADWYAANGIQQKPIVQALAVPIGKGVAEHPECNEHGHDWSPTAVWDKGELCAPCRRNGCEAELRRNKAGFIINEHGFKNEINGIALDIEDDPQGGVAKIIMREIETNYDLDSIPFEDGDRVIDIGAQVGIVSIYLAKKHPGIFIDAYEPSPENFARLWRNIKANNVTNVMLWNMAVTGDGRDLELHGNPEQNSGGISAFTSNGTGKSYTVPSVTLKEIFDPHYINRVKLLKIDCEGAEYEILEGSDLLDRIDYLRGEFHINNRLREQGHDPQKLIQALKDTIGENAVQAHVCEIAA